MKAGMIFARKTTWRSRLDLEYLDETSSRKLSSRNQQDDGQKKTRPLRQFADYASKETPGQVHVGGFLHHLILINEDGSRTAPSQLTIDERKRRISEAWFEHIRKHPTSSGNLVIQHRLVFSMSREMHDRLVDAGINPDRVLQSATKKIMGKFNERFHPADSIGYAYGIHHTLKSYTQTIPDSNPGARMKASEVWESLPHLVQALVEKGALPELLEGGVER